MGVGTSYIHYDGTDMTGYDMRLCGAEETIPDNAVLGGRNSDGSEIYIGSKSHHGDVLPAHIDSRTGIAHTSCCGKEVTSSSYDILVEKKFKWVKNRGGNVPGGAVPIGETNCKETLYVGRVKHAGKLRVGKVHPSHGVLYIGYRGKELKFKEYEILRLSG